MAHDEIVARQCFGHTSRRDQRFVRNQILGRHSPEAGRRDPGTDRLLIVGEIIDRGVALFVVPDRILVREEDAQRARDELPADFAGPFDIDCGCGIALPVVRFQSDKMPLAKIQVAVQHLHDLRINASFEHVHPDGGIKGGQGLAVPLPQGEPPPAHKAANADAGSGVIVAVIDTGIDEGAEARTDGWITDIPKSADNAANLDELDEQGTPPGLDLGAGHGTFVAGVIRQIAPAADVRIYRALDSDGIGSEEGIACAILRAWRDGATIINMSLGQESYGDHPPVALAAALELISDDVIVVAAAGNLGSISPKDPAARRPHWPAAFRRVVGVSATTVSGAPATWAKRGAWVDVSTQGEAIVSTFVKGSYEDWTPQPPPAPQQQFPDTDQWAIWVGTSFAAPQITGLLAAATSAGRYRRRVLARHALGQLLANGWYQYGYGILIDSPL